uniref:LRAT domain-containing protein n=1 Tax=Meloidogyne hapla TaxID=6305 RepID=A0A1I8BU38_MELHA
MGTDDCVGGNPDCWVESKPCKCGAQNWIATHVERVAIKFGGRKASVLEIPVEGGAGAPPVRRRSINLWRPIAGIFSVNLREEQVGDEVISPGPDDLHDEGPHEAIQVLFKCKKCNANFHCTYEMINEEKGKTQSFGHYADNCQTQVGIPEDRECSEEHAYEAIQRIYADMWDRDKFSRHFNNCRHWSDMFWWKLHPEEYKRKKAAEEHMGGRSLKA